MYGIHLKARRRRQGKQRGVNDDGEALKGDGNAFKWRQRGTKDDGRHGGQWRGDAYAYNCDSKALKFDGEVLILMERC